MKFNKIQIFILSCAIGVFLIDSYCFAQSGAGSVKLKAALDVAGVGYKNPNAGNISKLSKNHPEQALYSSGSVVLDYNINHDEELQYGAKISLQHTTRNDRSGAFCLYTESSSCGRLELGADRSAASKMMITGYKNSVALGNGWDMFAGVGQSKKRKAIIPYITNFGGFIDAKSRVTNMSDFARKITYFTPWVGEKGNRFQVGISYIPDTSNAGFSKINAKYFHPIISASDYKFAIIDAFGYGLSYEKTFTKDLSAKFSITGETGKPLAFNAKNHKASDVNFSKINVYNIGTEFKYQNISLSGSYMNYNKSVTHKETDKFRRDTYLYSLGGKYDFKDTGYAASAIYFFSNHKGNKLNSTTLELSKIITKGVKFYGQVTLFQTNGDYQQKNIKKTAKSTGMIFILGSKLSL